MENTPVEATEATEEAPLDSDTHHVSKPKDANAELRAYNDRLVAENAKLRKTAMRSELAAIGLNPDEGLGVAVVETYDGDEITADALSAYAFEKYKYASPDTAVPPDVAAGNRLEQVQAASQPVTPPPATDPVTEAETRLIDPEATRRDAIASITQKTRALQEQS